MSLNELTGGFIIDAEALVVCRAKFSATPMGGAGTAEAQGVAVVAGPPPGIHVWYLIDVSGVSIVVLGWMVATAGSISPVPVEVFSVAGDGRDESDPCRPCFEASRSRGGPGDSLRPLLRLRELIDTKTFRARRNVCRRRECHWSTSMRAKRRRKPAQTTLSERTLPMVSRSEFTLPH